jgi:hypothetical protein
MSYDPEIELFFQRLRESKAAWLAAYSAKPFAPQLPHHIVILASPEGHVVARHLFEPDVNGEYHQAPTGEIFFRYPFDREPKWYVNKSLTAFSQAATIFNNYCDFLLTYEPDEEVAAAEFVEKTAQFRSDLEKIEPLGDPATSLWSATIHSTPGGLLPLD